VEEIMSKRFIKNQRGSALLETAITIPIVLLVSVAVFEFGRAYQTWQVLTNAAREGARVAIIAGTTDQEITTTVRNYLTSGRLTNPGAASVNISRTVPFGPAGTASSVTVSLPFSFIVLNPVARLVTPNSTVGNAPLTMQSVAIMRNEG
jgi:Flp pilus assembly protein TadG